MSSVINIEDLSKKYIITHEFRRGSASLGEEITKVFKRWRGRIIPPMGGQKSSRPPKKEEFWALKNVSLEINQGERVGIIGRNGAGKTTLLKVLSRITDPTEGRIKIKGRVASLLEVGTGFHSELTGRENIFLNGAILGMSKFEIKRKFDEIVEFAGVEQFLDTPVKRYSSGMFVRLAFAVAAHLDPEILLVDEVLAVGDISFQKKCLNKMEDVAVEEGRTVLFVSHNMAAIQALCSRGIFLEKGKLCFDGTCSEAIRAYLDSDEKILNGQIMWPRPEIAPGSEGVCLKAVRIVVNGETNGYVDISEEFNIEIDYWNLETERPLDVHVHLYTTLGGLVFCSGNFPDACLKLEPPYASRLSSGLFRTRCTIPAHLLNCGKYTMTLFINPSGAVSKSFVTARTVLSFTIQEGKEPRKVSLGEWPGMIRPLLKWTTEKLSSDAVS